MTDVKMQEPDEKFNSDVAVTKAAIHATFDKLVTEHEVNPLAAVLAVSLASVDIAHSFGHIAGLPPEQVEKMVDALCGDMKEYLGWLLEQQASNSDHRLMQEVAHA